MNRRRAISGIVSFGILGFCGLTTYKVFSPRIKDLTKYKSLLGELVETIIPTTDTPGAKAAMVHEFIINAVTHTLTIPEQNRFIYGLDDVEDYAKSNFDKSFINCSSSQKIEVITHFQNSSVFKNDMLNKINRRLIGVPFYSRLKDLTVIGYCSSKIGATQGLAYDYIPGKYESCIDLNHNQRSWATK